MGEAVITPGFNLPAKYVIHAAGSVYRRQSAEQCEKLLRSAYIETLRLAVENNCESIAFPLISSGIYGYPKDEALRIAASAIGDFLFDHDIDVMLVVFDKSSFAVSRELLGAVESYIDEHYVETHKIKRRKLLDVERQAISDADECAIEYTKTNMEYMPAPIGAGIQVPLDDLVGNLDEAFSQMLLRLIDAKGMTDVEVISAPIWIANYSPKSGRAKAICQANARLSPLPWRLN
jgi:hypothetical protein